jgi:deoxyribodipyrimidine photo-lyase
MASRLIDDRRLARLNDKQPQEGSYVLYWMQASQRAETNHSLEFAIQRANRSDVPLVVLCVLHPEVGIRTPRQLQFVLQGLADVHSALARRNIPLVVRCGKPASEIRDLAGDASEVICDRGYLREQIDLRNEIASGVDCGVWSVESDLIVPVETAADKREYAARTIRRQLNEAAAEFVRPLATTALDRGGESVAVDGIAPDSWDALPDSYPFCERAAPIDWLIGGTGQAKSHLKAFVNDRLADYQNRSAVNQENVSHLSAYLHFGQISPLAVYQQVQDASTDPTSKEEFLEELLVRRELSFNFVHYEPHYDSLMALPEWAGETLHEHESDPREHHYTATELEDAETHDPAWNAMMQEMKTRGYLHNHLRMYWGKKIIEWTNTVDHAYRTALSLNNKYFIDGCDANSFANVLWLFGLHDRAYGEREVFGKVRYMSQGGLQRKFDVQDYIDRVERRAG